MPKDMDSAVQLCRGVLSNYNKGPVYILFDGLNQVTIVHFLFLLS